MYFYIKIIAIIENNFQHAMTVITEKFYFLYLRSMSQILIYLPTKKCQFNKPQNKKKTIKT